MRVTKPRQFGRRVVRQLLSEAQVRDQVIDALRLHRWQCVRLAEKKLKRGTKTAVQNGAVVVQEKDIYHNPNGAGCPDWIVTRKDQYCYLELKRTDGMPRTSQKLWMKQADRDGTRYRIVRSLEDIADMLD